ncbi:ATP-binding protein [Streptomyces sp. NPDC060205]|uniref:ATP-binding protein n=1 Tax=Streptomyces sp. NPDC060205 TaxID=3347072 RepID=UPI0036562268
MTRNVPRRVDGDLPVRVHIEAVAEGHGRIYAAGHNVIVNEQALDPPPAAASHTLPRDVREFTGRVDEVQRLLSAATGTSTGVVDIHTVNGMPGVGKTALVRHAAWLLADQFPDGQHFISLNAHIPDRLPADPAAVLATLLASLGVDPRYLPKSLEDRAGLWRDRLIGRRVLLVLDDAFDTNQVEPLLPGTGTQGCLVLVTSRRRIINLDGSTPLALDVLPAQDAKLLFTRLADRTGNTLGMAAEEEAVAEIVRLCGYLPLAIVLLARRIASHPTWNLTEYADEFSRTKDRLGELAAGDRAVAAAFELSYRGLNYARKRLFRSLGIHPGYDTDVCAAAALVGIPIHKVGKDIEALYTDHLIEEPVAGRFRLHDLMRAYAHVLALRHDKPKNRDRAIARLLDHYLHTAQAADQIFNHAPGPQSLDVTTTRTSSQKFLSRSEAFTWLKSETPNLLACLDYVTRIGQNSRLIQMTASVASILHSEGPWTTASRVHERAIKAARDTGDLLGQADAFHNLGRINILTGDYGVAAEMETHALSLYREFGNQLGEANALHGLGRARALTGDLQEAEGLLTKSLNLYSELEFELGKAQSFNDLGRVRMLTGEYPAAAELQVRSITLYRKIGNQIGEAQSLNDLGRVRSLSGDFKAAIAAHEPALKLMQTLGNRLGQANAANSLGRARLLTGGMNEAAVLIEGALNLYEELGNHLGHANALNNLGILRLQAGNLDLASSLQMQAANLYQKIGHRLGLACTINDISHIHVLLGDLNTAADLQTQALALFLELGDRQGQADVWNSIGMRLIAAADPKEALTAYQKALALAREVHSLLDEARALEGSARAMLHTGDKRDAILNLRAAVEIYLRIDAADAVKAANLLAHLSSS